MNLDAIETRANNATRGPWHADFVVDVDQDGTTELAHVIAPSEEVGPDAVAAVAINIARPDGTFIAHARTDVPALVARVRELEEENTGLRDDLDAATGFDFGDGTTVTLAPSGDDWRVSWPDPDAPGDPARFHPFTEDHPDRDAALARARQLKEDK